MRVCVRAAGARLRASPAIGWRLRREGGRGAAGGHAARPAARRRRRGRLRGRDCARRRGSLAPAHRRRRSRSSSAGARASCPPERAPELGDAAAVAIAMSDPRAARRQRHPGLRRRLRRRHPSPTAPPPTATAVATPTAAAPARGALTLALVVDAGALPNVGPGAALEGAVAWRDFRVVAGGTLFLPQLASASAGRGGDFSSSQACCWPA